MVLMVATLLATPFGRQVERIGRDVRARCQQNASAASGSTSAHASVVVPGDPGGNACVSWLVEMWIWAVGFHMPRGWHRLQ